LCCHFGISEQPNIIVDGADIVVFSEKQSVAVINVII
jgi:hypothetical protein